MKDKINRLRQILESSLAGVPVTENIRDEVLKLDGDIAEIYCEKLLSSTSGTPGDNEAYFNSKLYGMVNAVKSQTGLSADLISPDDARQQFEHFSYIVETSYKKL